MFSTLNFTITPRTSFLVSFEEAVNQSKSCKQSLSLRIGRSRKIQECGLLLGMQFAYAWTWDGISWRILVLQLLRQSLKPKGENDGILRERGMFSSFTIGGMIPLSWLFILWQCKHSVTDHHKSISLQTGRPWMIECSEFIESIEDWCNDILTIENDQLLGAFTTLRLITSSAFPLLATKSRQRSLSHSESAPLVSLLDGRIERWEKKWTEKITAQTEKSCHEFLIHFYGTHLRLQLHTLPLHGILVSDKSDINHHIDTVWVAYSSALNMLQLISRFSEHVCFAQDSIHVMTAYSAAFLVKVGLLLLLDRKTLTAFRCRSLLYFPTLYLASSNQAV